MHIEKRWIGLVAGAALFFALIGASAGLVLLTGDDSPSQPRANLVSRILKADRDSLAVCIDGVGVSASVREEVLDLTKDALDRIADHDYWEFARLDLATAADAGCPRPPVVYTTKRQGPSVPFTAASEYRIFLFVLTDGEVARLFAPLQSQILTVPLFGTLPEELTCAPNGCFESTTGLYVDESLALTDGLLTFMLHEVLGLDPPEPLP